MENQQQISPSSSQNFTLPGVGDLLKRAWLIYKARLGVFLGIMISPVIISFLFLTPSLVLSKLNPFLAVLVFIPIYLVISIISLWSQVSLLFAIKDREEKIGILESFKRSWHKIIPFFWVSILAGLISAGGFLLFIIPGIIFTIWFFFSTYVLISEDLKGMNALFRSKQLVSGKWGGVFWRLFVITVFFVLICFCIILPVVFFVGKNASNIISSILSLFLTPILITSTFLIYEDLKSIKDEIPFGSPKKGTKIGFILVGVLGFLLIPGILAGIVLTSLHSARERANETKIIMDMSQIRITAEMIYSEKESYIDVNCSSPEIASLCTEIFNQIKEKPVIHSSQDAYCAYIKLPSGKFVCIDSKLTLQKNKIN